MDTKFQHTAQKYNVKELDCLGMCLLHAWLGRELRLLLCHWLSSDEFSSAGIIFVNHTFLPVYAISIHDVKDHLINGLQCNSKED